MTTREKQVEPRCPNCNRLTIDNKQHCPDKKLFHWMETCGWMKCVGVVGPDSSKRRCSWVYGPVGWKGFQGN